MSATPPDPYNERQRLSRLQIVEASAASCLAAAIITSAGGVTWLVVQLPTRLQQLEASIERVVQNQERFENRFTRLEGTVTEHDRRIIKLELHR